VEDVKAIVTKRDDTMPGSLLAQTPYGSPNIQVIAMSVFRQVFVRAARTYITSLTGLLTAGGIGFDKGVLPNEFGPLLWACAGMALAPTVMSVLLNVGELLARFDQSHPQLRA
jgi:hypothetical protein